MDSDLAAIQEVRDCLKRAHAASKVVAEWDQQQTDRVVRAMCEAGRRHCEELARMAVEDSGFGRVEHKFLKNKFCTEDMWNFIKDIPTAGIIARDEEHRVYDVAHPMGVVAAIIPITNPTSTAMYKAEIAVKARNAIVVSPHPRGVRCIARSCEILYEAARREGAPEGLVECLRNPTLQSTGELMRHSLTDVILATGGPDLVKTAYSSGKPAIGVGPGNCPAYIDRSADVRHAVRCLVDSQTFDWATICSSEQSIVADEPVAPKVLEELQRQGAYICNPAEMARLSALVVDPHAKRVNPAIVGLAPVRIAQMAGFSVPETTTILICPQQGVGWDHPLSIEKLSPILAYYVVKDAQEGCRRCMELLAFGGDGHSLVVHARDQRVITEFGLKKEASRIMVNAPASQGSVGIATWLEPSMTLGCGTPGRNIVSANITPRHLINIKKIAYLREDYPLDGPAYHRPDMKPWERPTHASFEAPRAPAPEVHYSPPPMRPMEPKGPAYAGPPVEADALARGGSVLTAEDIQRIIQQALPASR
ncbi:MAG: aldehyde dehydrogenase family protein [Planctomycetes bacterium]|nr:aldehyde dehydrogenase family protein [Planctomycetota bacterium]